ncbi:MAG: alpha-galactosidase [Clostridia bacterium]|nr:alpha-galactosidase [Clostridia bacterium]
MPIRFDENEKIFHLDTATSSYVMEIFEQNYLLHLYSGKKIPDHNLKRLKYKGWFASFSPMNRLVEDGGFSPDICMMEYPGQNTGDFRRTAVAVRNADGNNATDFRYDSHQIYAGKPALEGLPALYAENDADATTLEITMRDAVTGMRAVLCYTVFEQLGAMTRSVRLCNDSDRPARIESVYSTCVDFPTHDYDLITLYGRWPKERTAERRPIARGRQGVGSLRGSSSHHQNPFAAVVSSGADEDCGEAYGFNLVYSSNFSFDIDSDQNGGMRVLMGINPDGFEWLLEPGASFQAPETVMVYSDQGIGEMSRTFHRLYRKHLIRGRWRDAKRPLLINNWEATAMDFTGEKLLSFARVAKELGMEMLVMDDGWFGNRFDDHRALGDWHVNEEKLGSTLHEFVEKVNEIGLRFGIWFEPEMISRDSDLYRAHPDWCLHVPGREKSIARYQYVLDYSRQDVRDYIYGLMHHVLSTANVAYLKWDFNRNLTEAGSAALPPERQGEIFHRCVLGTYEIMGRLNRDFPDLLIENCSGGGGRFDPGMLYYSPQIWTSDNTDPIERLTIQFGTSLCYPASTMGAHVSANKRTGYDTKANVALWGSFGYELDPNTFSAEEREIVKAQIAEYHKYYDVIHYGDLYRLIDPAQNAFRAAWMFVSEDKSEALVTSVVMRRPPEYALYLRLKGLDPDKLYREEASGEVYSGASLMYAGLNLFGTDLDDGTSFKLYFKEVKD